MSTALEEFRRAYASAFDEYVGDSAGERGLGRAYELGRAAVGDSLSMLELAAIHHDILTVALGRAGTPEERERVGRSASEFVIEALSTFEMAQRGFREAHETARLEQQHAAQLRGLAEAALAIAASHRVDDVPRLAIAHARRIVGARSAAACLAPDGDWGRARETVAMLGMPQEERPMHGMPELYGRVCHSNTPVRLSRADLEDGWLAAPITDRSGCNIGLIHLSEKLDGDFTGNDQAILVQLAQMASVSIQNALLGAREHEIAATLQRSLLPAHLPEIPGVSVAARYRPAGEGDEVGGDFYDVFNIGEGRWGIAIGDVCGKGAGAAAVTALARYTLRAVALHEPRPTAALRLLNEALLRHSHDPRFCTIAYAVFEPASAKLDLAVGGHPLPLLACGGQVEQLGGRGTVLGVLDDPPLDERSVTLEPGDTVVFYTDGVTDAHAPSRLLQPEELEEALAAWTGLSAPEVAARLEALALEGGGRAPRDDMAILVISAVGTARTRHVETGGNAELSLELSPTPAAAGEARAALAPLVDELGEAALGWVRLLLTELITNSMRHGRVEQEPVRVGVELTPTYLRVTVRDEGYGFELPPPSTAGSLGTSGWGLYLVDRLADRWGVDRASGTCVWFEIDR